MARTEEVAEQDRPSGGGEAESPHRLEQQRRENREAVVALGINPYGQRTPEIIPLATARMAYDPAADQAFVETSARAREAERAGAIAVPVEDMRPVVRVAGRIVLKRDGGKLIWLQLRDHTTAPASFFEDQAPPTAETRPGPGEAAHAPLHAAPEAGPRIHLQPDLQIAVSKKDVAEPGFEIAKKLDLGDVVVVEGPLMKTRAGEVTVWASTLEMGAKCLVPPPEKWSGLQDKEIRYRRRYVDLWANPETMWVATMRSRLLGVIRRYLDARGDIEVETPVLQVQAGGAAARPFTTHMNALDIDLFLRIAPELYHKRLLVGGMKGVYEISRNFRNEGMDRDHNPEFTCLEVYEAYGNYMTMLEMTEGLVRTCAWYVASGSERGWAALRDLRGEGAGELKLPFGELMIDYGSAFERVTYAELFERGLGFPMSDVQRAHKEAEKRGLKVKSKEGVALDDWWVINELFEEIAEQTLDPQRPTFVLDYPAALSPLTRPKRDDPTVAERWDLFCGGMELGPAYTELNDPDVQAAKFREQLAGIDEEESTFRTFDEDFIEALKVGMPPAGGMGLGIDRLCMLLLNQPSIRDVILFPMMRPE